MNKNDSLGNRMKSYVNVNIKMIKMRKIKMYSLLQLVLRLAVKEGSFLSQPV